MTRGKYATRSFATRAEELEEKLTIANAALVAEKAGRHAEKIRHEEQVQRLTREVAGKVADDVQLYLIGQTEKLANGLLATDWAIRRAMLTQHLAWLFLKGYLDWDRLNGDAEVVSFIATHGDLDAWFDMMDRYGHRSPRRVLRKNRATSNRGSRAYLAIEQDIVKALHGSGRPALRARDSRAALNKVVEDARSAFIDIELEQIADDVVRKEVTDEQRECHALTMKWISETRPLVAGA